MKRFLAFILAALMLLTLAACSSNGGNTDPQPDNDQNQSDEPSKDDPTTNAEYRVQELFGYGFKLEYDAVEESSNYGHTAATEEYELFIYGRDNILFENWDNVTDIAFKQLGNAIDSAYGDYCDTVLYVCGVSRCRDRFAADEKGQAAGLGPHGALCVRRSGDRICVYADRRITADEEGKCKAGTDRPARIHGTGVAGTSEKSDR